MASPSNVIIARGTDVFPTNGMPLWPVGQVIAPDETLAQYLGLAHIQPPRRWTDSFQNIDIVDNAGYTMVDPEPAFYLNMPRDARAMFSTLDGKYAKREVMTVRRTVWKWLGLKIYQKALHVRQQFPLLMRQVKKPGNWMDLYHYFDAHDIYNFGPYNLWNVISLLHEQNLEIEPGVRAAKLSIVDEWIEQWLSGAGNPQLLESWTLGTDIINILHPGDFSYGGVGQLDEVGLAMLRQALERKYHEYMSMTQQVQVQTWLTTTVSPPRDISPPLLPITEEPAAEEETKAQAETQPTTPPDQRASSAPGTETKLGTAGNATKAVRTVSAQPDLARDGSPLAKKPYSSAKKSVAKSKSPSSSAGDSWKSREFFGSGSGKKKPRQPVVQQVPAPVITPTPSALLANNHLGLNGLPMPPQTVPHLQACQPPVMYAPQMGPVPNGQPAVAFQGMPVANPLAPGTYPGQPFEASGFHQQQPPPPPPGPSSMIHDPPQQHHPDGLDKPLRFGNSPHRRHTGGSQKLDPTSEGWKPTKVDPLHGQTFSRDRQHERAHDGEPATRAPSSGTHGISTPPCLNFGRAGLHTAYLECYCPKCGPAQRSIVVMNFLPSVTFDSLLAAKLMEYFSKYEYVEYVNLIAVKRYAHVRFLSPEAAASVVNLAKRNKVDGISDAIDVKFPFYSKNYQPVPHRLPNTIPRTKLVFDKNSASWRVPGSQLPPRPPGNGNPFNRFHEPEKFHNAQKVTSSGSLDVPRLPSGHGLPPRPNFGPRSSESKTASAVVSKNTPDKAPKATVKSDDLGTRPSSGSARTETYQAKPRSEDELSDDMSKSTSQPVGEIRVRLPSPSKDAKAATSVNKSLPAGAVSAAAAATAKGDKNEAGSTTPSTIINTPPSPVSDAEQGPGTVIRHKRKQPRKRLPSEWLPAPSAIPVAGSPERRPTDTTADPGGSKTGAADDSTQLDLAGKRKGKKRRSVSSNASSILREGSPVSMASSQQTLKASDMSQPVTGGTARKKSKKFKKSKFRTDSVATDGRGNLPQGAADAEMQGTALAQAIPSSA